MPTARYSSALIYTWRRKLLDAEAARDCDAPEALPAPVFGEAVVDESVAAAIAAEHPAMFIGLPRGKRLSVFAAASPPLVAFSGWLYRQRNLVEHFFDHIKHFRGIATRYDKCPENHLAAVKLIYARIWRTA